MLANPLRCFCVMVDLKYDLKCLNVENIFLSVTEVIFNMVNSFNRFNSVVKIMQIQ